MNKPAPNKPASIKPAVKRFPANIAGLTGSSPSTPAKPPAQQLTKPQAPHTKAVFNSTSLTPKTQASGLGLDSERARAQMALRIQNEGVDNPAVIAALSSVERHRFVDSALANQAYEDTSLPIGQGQTISKPSVVGRMLSLLLECPLITTGRVLEIGTGCAYQAALLAQLAAEVYSVERIAALHDKARLNLHPLRIKNVHLILGDGMLGYPKGAPYAGIISAAGGEILPQTWIDQLALGGRLVAPTVHVEAGVRKQAILVLDKLASGIRTMRYENVHFVPLKSGVSR